MDGDSLLNEFFVDTQSHLEGIEEDALGLEKEPALKELIDDVFRRVHNIKGNAGMLGFTVIHICGQDFETFLDGVRERGVAREDEVEKIFDYLDSLKSVVNELKVEKGMVPDIYPTFEEVPESAPPGGGEAGAQGDPEAAPPPSLSAPQPGAQKPAKTPEPASVPEEELKTFLTFYLAGEHYGIDIVKVREIIIMEAITRVPHAKPFVEGVINLRDQVIPVFNLKKKLRINLNNDSDVGVEKNIIIVEISKVSTGLKVDEVTGIIALRPSMISSPESLSGSIPTDYLDGVGQTEEGALILLDAEDLCDPAELLY